MVVLKITKIKSSLIIDLFLISAVIGVAISYSKLYLFHIMLIIFLGSFKYRKIIKKLPTKLHYIFYLMFIWYAVSILWSINITYTFVYLFYIINGMSIVLIIIYYAENLSILDKILKILAIVFIIEIFFSLLEVFTSFRLPISPYSNYVSYFGRNMTIGDIHDPNVLLYIMQSPTGFQWNPNDLAITMLIICPFFLLYQNQIIKFIGIISIFILIIMSGSRGVFISFSFMIFLYLFFLSKKIFLRSIFISPLVIVLLFSNLDTLKNIEQKHFREIATSFEVLMRYLFEEPNEDKDSEESISARHKLIQNGLNALKNSYYLGVGGGGSVAVQEKIGGVSGDLGSMHNFWVEMLVDSGVLFTIIFMLWYIYILFKLYCIGVYTKHFRYKYYSQALFLSMSSFILGAVSASSVIYFFPMWIMFGLAIATINNYKRFQNENFTTL